jgi:inhibitor of cysteine peptidase
MRPFILSAFVLCFLAFALAETASKPAASQPATDAAADSQPDIIGAQQDGKTVAVIKGKPIQIQLHWNITTGYAWQLKSLKGDALEQVGELKYVANPHSRFVPGGGGKLIATFKTVKAGSGTIELVYLRPWEKNTPPVKTFTVTVKVEDAATTQPAATQSASTQPASKPAAESKPAEDKPAQQ